jgi:DNA-binding MarR family transcriptional regulator
MQFKLNTVLEDSELTSDQKVIYVYIFTHIDTANEFQISLTKLSSSLNISMPTIQKAILKLEKKALIDIYRNYSDTTGHKVNIYSIVL